MALIKCANCETEFEGKFCPECGAKEGKKLTEGTENERETRRQKQIDDVADRVVTRLEKKAEERRAKGKAKKGGTSDGGDDIFAGIID